MFCLICTGDIDIYLNNYFVTWIISFNNRFEIKTRSVLRWLPQGLARDREPKRSVSFRLEFEETINVHLNKVTITFLEENDKELSIFDLWRQITTWRYTRFNNIQSVHSSRILRNCSLENCKRNEEVILNDTRASASLYSIYCSLRAAHLKSIDWNSPPVLHVLIIDVPFLE